MLEEILNLPNGARFVRVDLHNHTPADPSFHQQDFKLETEEDKMAFARRYVEFARYEQKLDMIGITDHNDISWLPYIQAAGAEVGLTVIPGVELGANEGKRTIHYLALFEPGTDPTHIDHFISSAGLPPKVRFDSDGRPRLTPKSCRELTDLIVDAADGLPGLAIAAHVTRKNGLLKELEGESRVLAYEDENLLAVEIPDTRTGLGNFNRQVVDGRADHYGGKTVACLNSSDGRGLGQTKSNERLSIGDRATKIKLSHNSLTALRHALIDYDSRIRLEGDHEEVRYPRVIGLRVDNGFLTGCQQRKEAAFKAHLNPNLNTIIGGRGTGKSSMLEALRFVFDVPAKTDKTQKETEQAMGITIPPGARVVAWYETADGSRYQVSRTHGKPAIVTDATTGEPLNLPPGALLPESHPIEIYSQKEVYEIANDADFQLNLIDSYISDALGELRREESRLLRDLEANGQGIMRLADEIAENEHNLQELAAVNLELERLEKDETLSQLERKKTLEQEKRALAELEETQQRQIVELSGLQDNLRGLLDLDNKNEAERPLVQTRFPETYQQQQLLFRRAIDQLEALKEEMTATWAAGEPERDAWATGYAANEAEYEALLAKHGDSLSAERYFELQKRQIGLEKKAGEQANRENSMVGLQEKRAALLAELSTLRQERELGLRQTKVADLNTALNGTVRLSIIPNGNLDAYRSFLTDLFKRHGESINKKTIDGIVGAEEMPFALAAAIREEQNAPGQKENMLAETFGVTPAYRKRLVKMAEKGLYELETYRIPDRPEIALKVNDTYRALIPPPGVPGLSTGQKCTAILSIILIEKDIPLLIDQPEDDLDNAFIFSEIVQTLRREKERRQFIIATHNANIPVSGDAELIMLMEADEQNGWIRCAGSIDDPAIREPVENILEGGRAAFRLRQSKYNI